jgi:hypothetical protein
MGDNDAKRIGRPPIPAERRKTRLLHVRLTESDYATLASAAGSSRRQAGDLDSAQAGAEIARPNVPCLLNIRNFQNLLTTTQI